MGETLDRGLETHGVAVARSLRAVAPGRLFVRREGLVAKQDPPAQSALSVALAVLQARLARTEVGFAAADHQAADPVAVQALRARQAAREAIAGIAHLGSGIADPVEADTRLAPVALRTGDAVGKRKAAALGVGAGQGGLGVGLAAIENRVALSARGHVGLARGFGVL